MIAKWIVIGVISLGVLLTVGSVGKPRKPLEPGAAAVSVVLSAALIVTIVVFWRA